MDSVVRLSLERLNAPQRAYAIVRKTRSVEAAALLARYCLGAQVGARVIVHAGSSPDVLLSAAI